MMYQTFFLEKKKKRKKKEKNVRHISIVVQLTYLLRDSHKK
jgi:hypothetical protein